MTSDALAGVFFGAYYYAGNLVLFNVFAAFIIDAFISQTEKQKKDGGRLDADVDDKAGSGISDPFLRASILGAPYAGTKGQAARAPPRATLRDRAKPRISCVILLPSNL